MSELTEAHEALAATLSHEMDERRAARLADGWASPYRPNNPIASGLADCDRVQLLQLLAWQERPIPDLRGQEVIENGTVEEAAVLRQLRDEGWEIVQDQVRTVLYGKVNGRKEAVLTGKIDGKLVIRQTPDGPPIYLPLEVKSTSEYRYDSINSEADLQEKDQWTRKWWRQIQCYLLAESEPLGLLILSNCRGGRKLILVELDLEEGERQLKLAEWAMELKEQLEQMPTRGDALDTSLNVAGVAYHHDFSICRRCDWRDRVCFPTEPATAEGVPIKDWLKADVETWLALKEERDAWQKADKTLQDESRDNPAVLVGDYVIEGQQVGRGWRKTVRKVGE